LPFFRHLVVVGEGGGKFDFFFGVEGWPGGQGWL
jgi:hypothetical protein